jgi:hypothetical protein
VAIYCLKGNPAAQEPLSVSGVSPPVEAPTVIQQDQGRIEMVRTPMPEVLPPMVVQPLFEAGTRVKINETAKLQFAVHDRATGRPESDANLSATVFHGNDPQLRLPVEEVDQGVYEVPFIPRGPGQFNVVLSKDGVPIGSQRVGVVGVAGAPNSKVDIIDPLSVDPRQYRARTAGRGRRR